MRLSNSTSSRSPECQKVDWKATHKLSCVPPLPQPSPAPAPTPTATPTPTPTSRPTVLSLELVGPNTVNHETWSELFRKLRLSTSLTRSHTSSSALTALSSSPPPSVVLSFDTYLFRHPSLLTAIASYTRSGGTLIICACDNAYDVDFRAFITAFKLPFRIGGYYRSIHSLRLSTALSLPITQHNLPSTLSMKARTFLNVPESARLYAPLPNATVIFPTPSPGSKLIQRTSGGNTGVGPVFSAVYVNPEGQMEAVSEVGARTVDQGETPALWLKVGKGQLGFVGDINGEPGSIAVVLAMCGVQHGIRMSEMMAGRTIGSILIDT